MIAQENMEYFDSYSIEFHNESENPEIIESDENYKNKIYYGIISKVELNSVIKHVQIAYTWEYLLAFFLL